MKQFPIFLNLENRQVLVVGGDAGAVAKIRLLFSAGAKVTAIAENPAPEITDWAANGDLTLRRRAFLKDDLEGQTLVISTRCAANAVAPAVGATDILLNVIDGPEQSDFTVPAIIDREPVTVAVASNGLAPALARNLRQDLDAALPERLEDLVIFAANFRDTVARFISDGTARRWFWNDVFDGEIAENILAGKTSEARRMLISKLNSAEVGKAKNLRFTEITIHPEDLENLTRADLRQLRQADAILHDNALPQRVLAFARREAKRIGIDGLVFERQSVSEIARNHGIKTGLVVALRQSHSNTAVSVLDNARGRTNEG